MGQPDWSKISPDKWPEWKKREILEKSKDLIDKISPSPLVPVSNFECTVCGKICKSEFGLKAHLRKHNK